MLEVPGSTRGKILISNSSVIQDYFHKSIILMVDHDKDGAFGLTLNKPTNQTMESLIKNLPDTEHSNKRIYSGGPVDNMFVTIVHNQKNSNDPGVEIIPGIYMARSFDTMVEILQSKTTNFRVFQGYAGWAAGQLENEFEKLSWVVNEITEEQIFREDESEEIWKDALRSKGGIYKYFVEHTKDPLLN
ncbi:transcriptional regulator [Leptospira kobayashii]|uniref:Transcriptional regulator n=1 Tax=Leptospira kobayashii TaxID=1917830 RepID=A0ABN6KKB5_9LEPT|nr:YqgE/AlgH family protein [Leptospira kobayashii]BDA80582.1 transcriptional regulator [Leptospira kobayashii]